MAKYRFEGAGLAHRGQEHLSVEEIGHYAQDLFLEVIKMADKKGSAEKGSDWDDGAGADVWYRHPKFGDKEIPVDLTTASSAASPGVLEGKAKKAYERRTVIAPFTVSELELAARGGTNFQAKIIQKLHGAIEQWEEELAREGKVFVTREELATEEKAWHEQQEQRKPKGPPRSRKSKKKGYKRKKKERHDKRRTQGS